MSTRIAKLLTTLTTFMVVCNVYAKEPGPVPWHLVDIWYKLDQAVEFKSMSMDIEINGEPERSIGFYIAPLYGTIGGANFYCGMQNCESITVPATNKKVSYNRMGIFSRWSERQLSFTRPEADGWNVSSATEDGFIGVRSPYQWSSGKYTIIVSKLESEEKDPKYSWIQLFIHSEKDGTLQSIGAMKFPSQPLILSESIASFIEIFSLPASDVKLPRMTVIFSNLLVNGKTPKAKATAEFGEKIPDIAKVSSDGNKIAVVIGDNFTRQTRIQELW